MGSPIFVDFEFDGSPDRLLSMGLTQRNVLGTRKTYVVFHDFLGHTQDPWVKENVIPHLNKLLSEDVTRYDIDIKDIGTVFAEFFKADREPVIVADYGLDISIFAKLTIGPNHTTYPVFKSIIYQHRRIDAYPAMTQGLVQHHALDDAIALHDAFDFISVNKTVLHLYNTENKTLWINPKAGRGDMQIHNFDFCVMIDCAIEAKSISVSNDSGGFDVHQVETLSHKERLSLIQAIFYKTATAR